MVGILDPRIIFEQERQALLAQGKSQDLERSYKPRSIQADLSASFKRNSVLVCHRRFGKTVLAINQLITWAEEDYLADGHYFYLAPFHGQVKRIAWEYLKFYTAHYRLYSGYKIHESELKITLPFGSSIQLLGADKPDSLRGTYADAVVLDEYAMMKSEVWDQVVRPMLADRQGRAIFLGTPMGEDHFYEIFTRAQEDQSGQWFAACCPASQTGLIPEEELQQLRETMSPWSYAQEFECSFQVAARGSYYGDMLQELRSLGRMQSSLHHPSLPVYTAWDLGIDDHTAIWFFQIVGANVMILDYLQDRGQGLAFFAKTLQERPYTYGAHILPHDADARVQGLHVFTRAEDLRKLLPGRVIICPRQAVVDGIQKVRSMLSRCYFDEQLCKLGLRNLGLYHYDSTQGSRPVHDDTSHAADAFRYLALCLEQCSYEDSPQLQISHNWVA